MKSQLLPLAVLGACAVTLGACGDDGTKKNPFPQPANTVALSFSIDDSGGKTYTDGQLQWKGSFTYDTATRMLTYAADWAGGNGPYAVLYDDGPWDDGGHEPLGATKGDHKWGVTAFMTVPTAAVTLGYGAIDENGWIWVGDNGSLTVPANLNAPLTATGMAIPTPGTIDLRISIDTANIASPNTYTAGDKVELKGSYGGWGLTDITASSTTAVKTFTLSENIGVGKQFVHKGLLKTGDIIQFVFVLHGVEYKVSSAASGQGVTAETKAAGGSWTAVTVQTNYGTDKNTAVTIP